MVGVRRLVSSQMCGLPGVVRLRGRRGSAGMGGGFGLDRLHGRAAEGGEAVEQALPLDSLVARGTPKRRNSSAREEPHKHGVSRRCRRVKRRK